jgi:hypothetical protein
MIAVSLALYGFELYYGVLLLYAPSQPDPIFILAGLLVGVYGLGIVRAWELLGARRYGLLGWLNPLRDTDNMEIAPNPAQSRAGKKEEAT